MPNQRKSKAGRRNGGRSNGVNTIDLVNFGQTNRRTIIASFERDLSTNAVEAITIGRKVTGSVSNPLIDSWLGDDANGWPLESVRVKQIQVVFDCRGLGTGGFNARPRVGAFMSGDALAAIDEAKIAANIEQFGGMTISPNQQRSVMVKVGPEFALGRFGETGANTLVVYQRGFLGFARVIVHYEVVGFPASRVIVARALDSIEELQEPMDFEDVESSAPRSVGKADGASTDAPQ
jgi:hypothetical protein